jgi:hypothetical protein
MTRRDEIASKANSTIAIKPKFHSDDQRGGLIDGSRPCMQGSITGGQ